MELVLLLGLLYGLQCVLWLPRGSVLFVRPLGSWRASEGPGWRLLDLRPGGRAYIGERFPLVEREGRLHGRGALSWLASRDPGAPGDALDRADLARAQAHGELVRVGDQRVARSASAAGAEALAALLRELEGEGGRKAAERALAASLSPARLAEERARVDRATRWLAASSDVYAVSLFALLPALMAWRGEEGGLLLAAPLLAALHGLTLVCLARAHRRLRPARGADLVESLTGAALYPPLLLRGHHALRAQVLGGFHPALWAAALLPREASRRILRHELAYLSARAAGAPHAEGALGLEELELACLRELLHKLGEDEATLLGPPSPRDASAQAYCPACLCEYRLPAQRCADCAVELVAYED